MDPTKKPTDITPNEQHTPLVTWLANAPSRVAELARASLSEKTRQNYRSALTRYCVWTDEHGLEPFPTTEDQLCAYVAFLHDEGRSSSAIDVAVAAIGWAHDHAEAPDPRGPRLRQVVAGARRDRPTRPRKAAPICLDVENEDLDIRPLVDAIRLFTPKGAEKPGGFRDRAMVLMAFASGFREGELRKLGLEDVTIDDDAAMIRILLRRSKSDQLGEGADVVIHAARLSETY